MFYEFWLNTEKNQYLIEPISYENFTVNNLSNLLWKMYNLLLIKTMFYKQITLINETNVLWILTKYRKKSVLNWTNILLKIYSK